MTRAVLTLVTLALLLGGAGQANAGIIVNQTPADAGVNIISQVFPNQPASSTFAFDDFVTTQTFSLASLTVLGTERGDFTQNIAVTVEIWTGLPGVGSRVQAFPGIEDSRGTLNFNLGDYILPAGSYWLTAYVTRPVIPSGMDQWFIDLHRPVSGSQAYLYNPGGGFGSGTSPFPISGFAGLPPEDLAFTLSGDMAVVPEPSSLTLLGLGVVSLCCYTWRRRRTA
jgi:hypothetical protein